VSDGAGGDAGTVEGGDGAAWLTGSLAAWPPGIQSGAGSAAVVLPGHGDDDHWSRVDCVSHGGTGSATRLRPGPSGAWTGVDASATDGVGVVRGGAAWVVPPKALPSKAVPSKAP
jgi:hypothetical protein